MPLVYSGTLVRQVGLYVAEVLSGSLGKNTLRYRPGNPYPYGDGYQEKWYTTEKEDNSVCRRHCG